MGSWVYFHILHKGVGLTLGLICTLLKCSFDFYPLSSNFKPPFPLRLSQRPSSLDSCDLLQLPSLPL